MPRTRTAEASDLLQSYLFNETHALLSYVPKRLLSGRKSPSMALRDPSFWQGCALSFCSPCFQCWEQGGSRFFCSTTAQTPPLSFCPRVYTKGIIFRPSSLLAPFPPPSVGNGRRCPPSPAVRQQPPLPNRTGLHARVGCKPPWIETNEQHTPSSSSLPTPGPPAAGHCPSRGGNWRQGAGAGGRADRGDPTAAAAGSSRLPPGARRRQGRAPTATPRPQPCAAARLRVLAKGQAAHARLPQPGDRAAGARAARAGGLWGRGWGCARPRPPARCPPAAPTAPLSVCPSVRLSVPAAPGSPLRPATPHLAIQRLLYA